MSCTRELSPDESHKHIPAGQQTETKPYPRRIPRPEEDTAQPFNLVTQPQIQLAVVENFKSRPTPRETPFSGQEETASTGRRN